MAEPLADRVIRKVSQTAKLYHRLVMVVGPAGIGPVGSLSCGMTAAHYLCIEGKGL